MRKRVILGMLYLLMLGSVAWVANLESKATWKHWVPITNSIYRTKYQPYGYVVVDGKKALLIDATVDWDQLAELSIQTVDAVLLTHHHRDSLRSLSSYLEQKIRVLAPKPSEPMLSLAGVEKFWQENIPLRNSRTHYFVVPVGFAGISFSLEEGNVISVGPHNLRVVATPGHSLDHVCFVLENKEGKPIVFCGDALAGPNILWTPFTTDWDHWTDAGLKPTHESLRKLAKLKPAMLLPSHGEMIQGDTSSILEETAKAVEEVAFLKSFERFSQRLGSVPKYNFLVPKEQVASAGEKAWSQVSDHLWITGNTYVLISKEKKAFLVVDPWGKRSVEQITKLKNQLQLGPLEVVLISHAHFDHYDGIYELADRTSYKVWTLDRVAQPILAPFARRSPFLDARPIQIDQTFTDGDTTHWQEYRFRFHHFPGQTEYTMAVETTIDGKKCVFTADNFFHQNQFSGSGGWMGLNRSFPLPYSASAQKILDLAPDWVLAEHGGPFEFHAEDFRRRVQWAKLSAQKADAICTSGIHRQDWDPNRITCTPILLRAKPGTTSKAKWKLENHSVKEENLVIRFQGRNKTNDQSWTIKLPAASSVEQEVMLPWSRAIPIGRHVFSLEVESGNGTEPVDAFVAVDIE